MTKQTQQYDRPIAIAEGVYWVGFNDEKTNFHCNPYLIIEGDQAALIDGGSRPDFAEVMMKVLQTGLQPRQITAMIYHHYDPDLCGSMLNLIDIIDNQEMKILSDPLDRPFLTYYIGRDNHGYLEECDLFTEGYSLNGRLLQFIKTPFCHNAGSFITYDSKTKTLFTSDLFGSFSTTWDLYVNLSEDCGACNDYEQCPNNRVYCPLPDILKFHQKIMPSGKALRYAMEKIKVLDIAILAPQHGGIFTGKRDIEIIIDKLATLEQVGIDAYL